MNQTAKVYEIPEETREIIEAAVGAFLHNGTSTVRKAMFGAIMMTLRQARISRMNCSNFKVIFRDGLLQFYTNNLSTGACPKCNTDYRAVTTKLLTEYRGKNFIEHVYGCSCGMVFKVAHGRDE